MYKKRQLPFKTFSKVYWKSLYQGRRYGRYLGPYNSSGSLSEVDINGYIMVVNTGSLHIIKKEGY